MNKEEKQTVVVKVGESTSFKTYESILYYSLCFVEPSGKGVPKFRYKTTTATATATATATGAV